LPVYISRPQVEPLLPQALDNGINIGAGFCYAEVLAQDVTQLLHRIIQWSVIPLVELLSGERTIGAFV